jgi:hypothetical protein
MGLSSTLVYMTSLLAVAGEVGEAKKAPIQLRLVVPGKDDIGMASLTPVLVPLPRANPFAINPNKSQVYIDAYCKGYLDSVNLRLC